MEKEILIARNLDKSYGSNHAVKGISFSIAKGEIFGLLGPNGAGKSTTISMLAGLVKPDGGQIIVSGIDLQDQLNSVKARIGLVPQELALYPTLSAWDNLVFFGQIYGLRGKRLKERVAQVLEMVQLADRAKEPIKNYSGGMKRRINLAAGLLHQPEILFLDEPTVGVDPQSRNAIFESIEALNRVGLTVIYTTHYMEEAERLCQRVAIVDHGQVIALGTPRELKQRSAGKTRIEIRLARPESDTALAQLEAVTSVHVADGAYVVQSTAVPRSIVALVKFLEAQGNELASLEIATPSLEDVFLELTGRRLRD
jgi:ABC-2 type transport system ATP-binding protein